MCRSLLHEHVTVTDVTEMVTIKILSLQKQLMLSIEQTPTWGFIYCFCWCVEVACPLKCIVSTMHCSIKKLKMDAHLSVSVFESLTLESLGGHATNSAMPPPFIYN
jgi:hypothetical protein